jgi:O-antigen/teichoic acid export membrane protein
MTSELDTTAPSRGDRARSLAYFRDLAPAMLAYVVIIGAVVAFGDLDGTSPWRFVWALLPVLPVLGVVRAVVRGLRRSDEYAQLVQLRGLAAGFAVAMVAYVILGMLTVAGLTAPAGPWLGFSAGMAAWAAATAVASR